MQIQVIIPVGDTQNLGAHYNRAMQNVDDWVCFFDHDILNLNPNWYNMCLNTIKTVGHTAGWITGVTNAIACPNQYCSDAPKNNDILDHMRYAKTRYKQFENNLFFMDPATMGLPFSGFMILTHKQAWEKAGGFTDGFLGVDNIYFKNITQAGFKSYVLPGLYMYHVYGQKKAWHKF